MIDFAEEAMGGEMLSPRSANARTGRARNPANPHRRADDVYETATGAVEAALETVRCFPQRILDIGAGGGAWGRVARRRFPSAHITGVEVRSLGRPVAYDEWHVGDYRRFSPTSGYDLVMSNPPFKCATECLLRSFKHLNEGGQCLFLLPIYFLETPLRRELFRAYPLCRLDVFVERPRFSGFRCKTAFAAGIFTWQRDYCGEPRIGWITPRHTVEHQMALEL